MLPGDAPEVHRRPPSVCPECLKEYDDPRKLAFHLERHREVKGPVYAIRGALRSRECPKKCGRHFLHPKEYREHAPLCDGQQPITREQTLETRKHIQDGKLAEAKETQLQREEEARARASRVSDALPKNREPRKVRQRAGDNRLEVIKEAKHRHDEKARARAVRASDGPPGEKESTMVTCPECSKECANGTGLSAHRRHAHGVQSSRPRKATQKKPKKKSKKKTTARTKKKPVRRTPRLDRDISDSGALTKALRERASEHRDKADRLEKMAEEVATLL